MSRFIAAYTNFVSKASDMPFDYIHAGALACISTVALGRRWVDKGKGIRPNLFLMITGPSTAYRKSSAVEYATDVIKEVDEEKIGPNDFTPEYLISYMRRRPRGKAHNRLILPIPEFGSQLAQSQTYAATLGPMLCDLYDGSDYRRGRVGKKMQVVTKPRLSMLGAVAYGMLEEHASGKEWASGFFPRMLWVAPNFKRPAFPSQPPKPKHEEQLAVKALADLRDDLAKKPTPMTLSPQGDQVYDQFSTWLDTQYDHDDQVRSAYAGRLRTNCWKLAMLYEIDAGNSTVVSDQSVFQATEFCKLSWKSFLQVFKLTAGDDFSRNVAKMRRIIKATGETGISRSLLLKTMHTASRQFMAALDLLMKNGDVIARRIANPNGAQNGRAPTKEVLCYVGEGDDGTDEASQM